jgi:hypothetical protein
VPRNLFGFAAFLALVQPSMAEQTGATAETLIRLTLHPAAAPRPALKYRLLPELLEMRPGNPIQGYMKCMMEQRKFFFDEEALRRRETLLAMPLNELNAQELNEDGQYVLALADAAARLDNPDWQTLERLKSEGYNLLLPEVQQIRSVVRALEVRFRAEIAQSRFDDAIRTAKTMFAIARHLGEHPTAIGNLVGMAAAFVTIYHFDELLQQPGCPNLYWALTNLPSPLIRVDKGLDAERACMTWCFRALSDRAPMSSDQIKAFVTEVDMVLDRPTTQAWLNDRVKDEGFVTEARRRLLEFGLPEERLLRFPAEQVVLLDQKRDVEIRFDDLMKTYAMPIWELDLRDDPNKPKNPATLFADTLVPALKNVRTAQGRVDQRIVLLRLIEALRLYAAGHDGKVPAKLADIGVPLPVDPITGKPVRYDVIGETAHLRGTPPPGRENVPIFNMHYEILFSH